MLRVSRFFINQGPSGVLHTLNPKLYTLSALISFERESWVGTSRRRRILLLLLLPALRLPLLSHYHFYSHSYSHFYSCCCCCCYDYCYIASPRTDLRYRRKLTSMTELSLTYPNPTVVQTATVSINPAA